MIYLTALSKSKMVCVTVVMMWLIVSKIYLALFKQN